MRTYNLDSFKNLFSGLGYSIVLHENQNFCDNTQAITNTFTALKTQFVPYQDGACDEPLININVYEFKTDNAAKSYFETIVFEDSAKAVKALRHTFICTIQSYNVISKNYCKENPDVLLQEAAECFAKIFEG